MKKSLSLIVCLFIAVYAQEENTFLDRTALGVKLGVNIPDMAYSDKEIDDYTSATYANFLGELFGEYAFIPYIAIRPGIKYTTRGQHIDEAGFKYEFNAKYAELTIPAVFILPATKDFSLYLLGGPVLGLALGGDILYREGDDVRYKTKINKSNTSTYAFGLYLGTGFKYALHIKETFSIILGFEGGYHLGLTDTYSKKEIDETANALNAYYYDIEGTRKNRGIELGITFAIPLANFKKPKQPEPEPQPEPPPPPEPEKLCYTINEMKELLSLGQDIHGKKICAIEQVNFKFGSAELLPEDKVYLDQIVILMKTNDLINVRVNGHTDNIGGDEYNMNLSHDRAKSVHDYLVSSGIPASRLSFAFFGSTRPIASNETEEGRAINRRTEFEITNQ